MCLCLSAVTCLKKALELPHLDPHTHSVANTKRNAAIARTRRLHQAMITNGVVSEVGGSAEVEKAVREVHGGTAEVLRGVKKWRTCQRGARAHQMRGDN